MLQDKVIIVTDAQSVLGRAAIGIFVEEGANVVGIIPEEPSGMTRDADHVAFVAADINDAASIEKAFTSVALRFGRLDGAFNNAEIRPAPAIAPDTAVDDFDESITINLRSTFLCLQQQLRLMRPNHKGAVVNLSSVGGIEGLFDSVAYCASKSGVIGMTRVAALDMAESGIRINALCPGRYEADGVEISGKELADIVETHVPMKRVATPKEIVNVAAFLLSDKASYVTGQSIVADGGIMAGITTL
jgi:NAD(P)-dependent dehydrogenase (short-subunit alcohol dehydrogenase family)